MDPLNPDATHSRFFERFANRGDVESQATTLNAELLARRQITAMGTIFLVTGGIVTIIHGTAREYPHAAGELHIRISLHHKNLQVRTVVDQQERRRRSYGDRGRIEFRHNNSLY